jgi:hypothetical protein
MAYRFAQVDTDEDDVVELLTELHLHTFGGAEEAPLPLWENGHWWIGWEQRSATPAAFCGITQSILGPGIGYHKRAGVVKGHYGNGLQRRMIRLRERKARSLGFTQIVTDTTNNWRSANNLIAEGYRLWAPVYPWAFEETLYWRKFL